MSQEAETTAADNIATLLFSLFIYVADADEGLSAREVQCLHEMLDNTGWCDSAFLNSGLQRLRGRYSELWKDYQKKTLTRDLRGAGNQLAAIIAAPAAPTAAQVTVAVKGFVDHLFRNSSPTLIRLGLAAVAPAKQRARADVEALLARPADELKAAAAHAPALSTATDATPATDAPAETTAAELSIWPAALLQPSAETLWKRGRTPVHCVAVIPETHDVKTFVFQALQPVMFAYKPGQFVTLELPIDGKTVRRSYTISSSPSRPYAISITVKRVPQGQVSNWLHDNMNVGFGFNLSGPHGEFTCFDAPAPKLLLIAAGSGVTPIMSMLRWLADTSSTADVVFLNNIRTPADVIFEREIAWLGSRLGANLKAGLIPGHVAAGQAWNGPVAHFSEQLVKLWAPDFAEREVFVCGPAGYMDMVRTTLERIGYPMQRYHQESFGASPAGKTAGAIAPTVAKVVAKPLPVAPPTTLASAPSAAPPGTTDKVEIVFSQSLRTLIATSEDFILDLADEHGIKLESSCRAGNCGTCKIRKTEGEVEMDDQQALSEADLLDGYVLACIGRATGKRVILEA